MAHFMIVMNRALQYVHNAIDILYSMQGLLHWVTHDQEARWKQGSTTDLQRASSPSLSCSSNPESTIESISSTPKT